MCATSLCPHETLETSKNLKPKKSLKIRSLHLFRDVVFSVHRFVLFSAPPALFSLTSFRWNNFNDVLHDCFVTGSRLISRTRRVLSTGKLLIPEYQAAHCCFQKKNKKQIRSLTYTFFYFLIFLSEHVSQFWRNWPKHQNTDDRVSAEREE